MTKYNKYRYLRADSRTNPLDDALTHFVEVLPLDLEAGGFDTTEHSSITVNLAQTRQQKRNRFLAVGELFEAVGFQQMDVHVHADQLCDLQSCGRTVGTFQPLLFRNCSMIRKVLSPVFIDCSTQRLTAIVVDLVELQNVEVEQIVLDDWPRIVEPTGESPLELERLSVDQVIVEITEPLMNALTVLKDVHVLELEAGQHRGFEFFVVAVEYLRHDFLLGGLVCRKPQARSFRSAHSNRTIRPACGWRLIVTTA